MRGVPTTFQRAVLDVLVGLERGQVVSYGWVAREAGSPNGARAVGDFLRNHPDPPHWWRVVAADGKLVAPHAAEQARRLVAEGHQVEDGKVLTEPMRP